MAGDVLMSFSDSDNSSSVCYPGPPPAELPCTPDVAALRLLSFNLESLLSPGFDFCADAFILVGYGSPPAPRKVAVHRCVLAARSPFFRELFAGEKGAGKSEFEVKELVRDFEVGYDALAAVLGYVYSGRVGPLPEGVCVCVDELCPHLGCRPAVDFMVQVLYASFVFQITEFVSLYQRRILDILENVANDDILVILSVANLCNKSCGGLLMRCIEIVAYSDLDVITLEKALPPDILKQSLESRLSQGLNGPESTGFPDKHVKRIHRALDSHDVELVRMLLEERNTTLDDAHALHYAVAYCDAKITMELMEIGADVNHRNLRGYTVLHIAAMRKEPNILASLVTKGARTSDLTTDGRNALQIAKRLTKYTDYYRATGEGMHSPTDRLCIEILEQAERTDPQPGEASVSLALAGDDARSRLLYLENRVSLAKLLFPMEAKVAMDIAQVDGTLEFTLGNSANLSAGNKRSSVDLNDTPFIIKEEHLSRIKALSWTVEHGKRFFPRCSRELDQIMDDEKADFALLGNEKSEERLLKKQRFQELQDIFRKAFSEDKEENDRSTRSSSSSSTSVGGIRTKFAKK